MIDTMEQENSKNITTLDSLIEDRQLQMMKAAIPYINNSSQKTMAFLIKYMELERTVAIFTGSENSLQMCSAPQDETAPKLQLLTAIREYCTEQEKETIDTFFNYMQMFSAYETLFT